MGKLKSSFWLGIFLCSAGMVYTGPVGLVNAQSQGTFGDNAGTQPQVIDLYEQKEQSATAEDLTVEVGSFGEISIHTKPIEITKVLQLLSIQSKRNIIASRNVSGEVSANLYGVDFYEALDAILESNGFGYREKGNFIYVYTQDELKVLDEMDRRVVTKIVKLNYMNSADMSAFLQPLLSQAGTVTTVGPVATGYKATLSDGGADSFADTGTIVIRDYEDNMEQVLSLVHELDVRPAQVLIESWILQATLDENNEFGVDFAIFTDVNISDFTNPLNAINEIIAGDTANPVNSGQVITSQVGQTNRVGGAKLGFFGSDFSVFVRALDQVTDTTVLAKPQLLVLNRQKAELLVGEKLGYLSTTQTETSTTQTVEFLDVGTSLNVRPFVSNDGFVRMELMPKISEGSVSDETGTTIPNESTSQMTTNVMVKSGQTVVLGGFFRESNQIDRRQIPGLGDIPIAGAAFKGQDDTIRRDEVIFMIRPTVIKDKQLTVMGDSALDGAQKAIMGSREGLLPFSQAKMSNAYLRDAREQLARGENDKAMWAVDAALYVYPSSVEAMRLKEQLTGAEFYYSSNSILDSAIDSMINAEVQKQVQEESVVEEEHSDHVSVEPLDQEAVSEEIAFVDDSHESETKRVSIIGLDLDQRTEEEAVSEDSEVDEILASLRSIEGNEMDPVVKQHIIEETEIESDLIVLEEQMADESESVFEEYDTYLAENEDEFGDNEVLNVFEFVKNTIPKPVAVESSEDEALVEVDTDSQESPLK
ncbi:hypothetical protein JD969_07415 [Planctomycetota bacterium]|nr:hypothetical protein JD969_07415 [Planctomycetota bacterium]